MWTIRRIVIGAVALIFSVLFIPTVISLWHNVDAGHILVVQAPLDGTLTVYTDPGVKFVGMGKTTTYPRQKTYDFGKVDKDDRSKKLRFNDGGHGSLYGSVRWEMPLDAKAIISIHKTFGSPEAVEQAGVGKMVDAAVYLTGPLMSSTESSAERRSELVQDISDQAERGVYVTVVREKEVLDPITNVKKEVQYTEIVRDKDGNPKRQQGSILQEFGIKLQPLTITELKYDEVVEDQIKQRQVATTQVQIAQAKAKEAEQRAVTAVADGKAAAATAQWKQEAIKATEVTLAQQKLEVATLAAKEAEQYKREQVLRGEGDSQAKQLRMNADGALDAKLEAYVHVNERYAKAIESAQPGAWTPSVVMGQGTSTQGGAATLVDLFTAKTARELGIDMSVGGKAATARK